MRWPPASRFSISFGDASGGSIVSRDPRTYGHGFFSPLMVDRAPIQATRLDTRELRLRSYGRLHSRVVRLMQESASPSRALVASAGRRLVSDIVSSPAAVIPTGRS